MRGVAILVGFVLVAGLPAMALELDLGAGVAIDVAPYGVETVAALALVAPWIGPRGGWQGGVILAASASTATADVEAAACARFWFVADAAAVYAGAGALVESGGDPVVEPLLVGGLRLETGRLACHMRTGRSLPLTGTTPGGPTAVAGSANRLITLSPLHPLIVPCPRVIMSIGD